MIGARLVRALLVVALPAWPGAGAAADRPSIVDERLFESLHLRALGPYRGGRSSAVAGVPSEPFTFYAGTPGGLWKTTNAGESWENVSDQAFEVGSIGAVAVADSDPNVVYAGTGQATVRGNVSIGRGIYKSTDAGRTWQFLGLEDAGQIARLRIHPRDPDLVYAGVVGNPFSPSDTRGVFRSRDGGLSWQRVLDLGRETGIAELVIDATNPRVLYASGWTVDRKPWRIRSGGGRDGLYRTTDGGDTWHQLAGGLPTGTIGKIGVAVSPADGQRVWALVEAEPERAGLYRSDDAGLTWTRLETNQGRALYTRSWYYMHVFADPVERERVYVLAVSSFVSTDGGRTFERFSTPHGDGHDLWINPRDPRIVAIANDGGAQVSVDRTRTWSTYHNQPTAEIYNLFVDDQFPYRVYGAQQDNTTISLPSRFFYAPSPEAHWQDVGGCESGHIAFDPKRPVVFYAGCYAGEITRYNAETGDYQHVLVYPQMEFGRRARDLRYRFNWNAPVRLSPHDPSVVYHASQVVHRSRDGGRSWTTISPDLTTNDPETQDVSGVPITNEATGVEVYNTIFAFEESPRVPGLLWAGSDDGRLHLSRDAGASWHNVTPRALPARGTVNMIELSPHHPGRALIAVKRFMLDDWAPYVFVTDDYGASWRALTDGKNGIPARAPVRVVREDPAQPGLLYAGTEFGLYASWDGGQGWQSLQLDLPPVPITDLRVHQGDLVLATQGRGFWVLDDLTPVRQAASAQRALYDAPPRSRAPFFLFPPRDTVRVAYPGDAARRGENPPEGVVFFYALGDVATSETGEELALEILDQGGAVIRRFSSERAAAPNPEHVYFADRGQVRLPKRPGLNRFVWNFRYPPVDLVAGTYLYGLTHGPRAKPGSYRARWRLGEREWVEREFRLAPDPRLAFPPEEYDRQLELSLLLYRDLERIHQAARAMRSARAQIDELLERAAAAGLEVADLRARGERLSGQVEELELLLRQPRNDNSDDVENFEQKLDGQIAYVYTMVDAAEQGPTAGQREIAADLHREVDAVLARWRALGHGELAAFSRDLTTRGVALLQVPLP